MNTDSAPETETAEDTKPLPRAMVLYHQVENHTSIIRVYTDHDRAGMDFLLTQQAINAHEFRLEEAPLFAQAEPANAPYNVLWGTSKIHHDNIMEQLERVRDARRAMALGDEMDELPEEADEETGPETANLTWGQVILIAALAACLAFIAGGWFAVHEIMVWDKAAAATITKGTPVPGTSYYAPAPPCTLACEMFPEPDAQREI